MDIKQLKQTIAATKGQDYMSDEQIGAFKAHLLSARAQLINESNELVETIKESGVPKGDEGDLSFDNEERAKRYSSLASKKSRLTAISKALEQVRLGDYGYCEDCGDEIGLDRLLINPSASRDVECANIHDIKMKQTYSGAPQPA